MSADRSPIGGEQRRDERGSAGLLLAVGICAALFACTLVAAQLVGWFGAVRSAEQGAELAALAAAGAAEEGGDPCEAASQAAERNSALLSDCDLKRAGTSLVVECAVRVRLKGLLAGAELSVERRATAGN